MTTTILGEDVALISGGPPTMTADKQNPVCTRVISNQGTNLTTLKVLKRKDTMIDVMTREYRQKPGNNKRFQRT